jgi:hypothetical protein
MVLRASKNIPQRMDGTRQSELGMFVVVAAPATTAAASGPRWRCPPVPDDSFGHPTRARGPPTRTAFGTAYCCGAAQEASSTATSVSSSLGGLAGGLAGAIHTGTAEGVETGATIGGLAEGGLTLSAGVGRMAWREYQFSRLYEGSTYTWRSVRAPMQDVFGISNLADRVRPNALFPGGVERLELSHFISQRSTKGYEWLFNRPWNIGKAWGTQHALMDPFRFQFMSTAFKSAYGGMQYRGLQQFMRLAPEWMLQSGYGVGRLGVEGLRLELTPPEPLPQP